MHLSHEDYRNTEYWYNLRKRLYEERAGYCEKCHKRLYGEDFDIHHIDGRYRMFDEDPDNLQLLCRECHSTFHKADYILPDGIHDFKVVGVEQKVDRNGEEGYKITLSVERKYDGKECYCWYWAQKGSKYEHWFRISVGLPEACETEFAVDMTGRALIRHREGFNVVDKFFTKVI